MTVRIKAQSLKCLISWLKIFGILKQLLHEGRGGGQVVSVLAFYSDDPSSNPAEAYSLFSVQCVGKDRK